MTDFNVFKLQMKIKVGCQKPLIYPQRENGGCFEVGSLSPVTDFNALKLKVLVIKNKMGLLKTVLLQNANK